MEAGEPVSPELESSATEAKEPVGTVLPDRIGPYEIIEELGRGGMGCIYAARQIGLGRIVALKVLAPRGDVAGLDLRFMREAQTIARLHHPHIVAVYDFGRAGGYVYFSMEYVAGGDLGRVLRMRPVAPTEAAGLVEKIGGAVAAAHAEGVLHRDIKPTNILLDGNEPKLADFGLAAQLEPGGDLTAYSGVLGTPHYLAPEALRGGSAALSVASDIYALGAVLFELLTGRTPYAGASPAELASLVEREDPPSPRLLAPALPKDLETICLKCLARDPARRYRSAADLAADLRRFRNGEAIVARPAGRMERWSRVARRHRVPLALTLIAVLALLGGAAISTWLAIRARGAEKLAAAESAANREVADFLRDDLLAQASPSVETNRDLKLRTVLDRSASKIEGRFQSEPLVEAAVRETLATTYNSLGDFTAGRRHIERALALRIREQGSSAPETLHAASILADTLYNLADYPHAESIAERTISRQRTLLGRNHPDTLATQCTLGEIFEWEGRLSAAESLFRDTLARQQKVLGPQHPDTINTMEGLASALLDEGKFTAAEKLLREMLTVTPALGRDNRYTLVAMNDLAGALWSQGRFAEAAELHRRTYEITRRVLGPEHPDTLRSMTNLARTYAAEGRPADAVALNRTILEIRRRTLGEDYQETLRSGCYLAAALRDLGQADEAEQLFVSTLQRETRVLGEGHPDTQQCANEYGALLLSQRRYAAAATLLEHSLAARHDAEAPKWQLSVTRFELGSARLGLGEFAAAEPLLREAAETFEREQADTPAVYWPLLAKTQMAMADLYDRWGKPQASAPWRQKALGRGGGTAPSTH